MDKFNNCTLADASLIAKKLHERNNLIFKFDCGNCTVFEIFIGTSFASLGFFDGHQCYSGAYIVAIKYCGMFHFNFRDRNNEFHPNYVSEKLNIPLADAEHLAKLFNGICAELAKIKLPLIQQEQ